MAGPMQFKISYKLIAAVGGVTAVIIGIFAYLNLKAQKDQLNAELERSAHQLIETVKNSTKYDMLVNQSDVLHRVINTIGGKNGIEKVRIFNKEGRISFSTDAADIGKMLDKKEEACYACHAADQPLQRLPISKTTRFLPPSAPETLGIIDPIYNEPSCWQSDCHAHSQDQEVLGVLDITMSLAEVNHGMRTSQMRVLIFAIIAIAAVSLMIYLLINSIVLKPVSQMVAATQHVAAGDLSYTVSLKKRDELGELANSFNAMTRQLSEAQRQLYHSDKLASVGRLAAGVAHEINNPLTAVLTYSSYLHKRLTDRPEMKEDLEVIVRETKRCREIVKGLLDFARQSTPEKRPIDVNEIVRRAVRILQNQFALHHIELEQNLPPNLPPVSADASQMQQVLVNLFMNADDAIGEKGGRITVTTAVAHADATKGSSLSPANQYVQIKVRDTGCGIPPGNVSKIFEPFFTTKGQKGNGLGLAMVWGIIEKHDGLITVESEPGKGTAFNILLPVDDKQAKA
jgi:two-component system NtrC family sensor kinase